MLLLSLTLAAALYAPQQPAPPPDPLKVKAAVAELARAFEKGLASECVAAIQNATPLIDASVIEGIARGLKSGDKLVVSAALEALRAMPHAKSSSALVGVFERDKKLRKDPELAVKLVKAIGQHQFASTREVLAAGGVNDDAGPVIEARILAIANVRSVESVETLIAMMRTAGREKIAPYLPTFRVALMRLVGEDAGHTQEAWMSWWGEHKKGLEVSAQAAPMPREQQLRWDSFWGNEIDQGRSKKRGERGNDGVGGK